MLLNLTELFEVQRKLDAEIERKHPVAPGEDRLVKRILALQVELGECANEWRGFKFWSTNQKPNEKVITKHDIASYIDGVYTVVRPAEHSYPLLEEYVDCLHFILSVGLDLDFTKYNLIGSYQKPETIDDMFLLVNEEISVLSKAKRTNPPIQYLHLYYSVIFDAVIALGEMLGFTWEQVIEAYMKKNEINHERQQNGY